MGVLTAMESVKEINLPLYTIASQANGLELIYTDRWQLRVTMAERHGFHVEVARETVRRDQNRTMISELLFEVQGKAPLPVAEEPPKWGTYAEYLASDHWLHMRELAREHYGEACCLCGSFKRIETHHRSYERLGRERLSDLIRLCRDCHAKFHDKLP